MTPSDTETRILEAAAELIAERGYTGTTTSAIAEEAGVNEVTLFRRFESKAGVLQALAAVAAASRGEFPPPAAVVDGDLRATLRNLATLEIRDAIASGGLVLRLTLEARSVSEVQDAMSEIATSNLERMANFLRGRQADGELRADIDPWLLAEAFFGLTSTLVMQRSTLAEPDLPEEGDIEKLAGEIVDMLWSGVSPKGRG
ncbi:MAG: TetR/AcrR family transcriptional regulator [Candidatus Limnocylindrales bacterium]